jgi:hypothetical protein
MLAAHSTAISAAPREVEAERFVVKDKDGATKATLGVGKGGGGELEIFGADGTAPIVTLSVSNDGSSLVRMRASNGKDSIQLRVEKSVPSFLLLEREKDMGFLATCRGGYPSFTVSGEGGKSRMILSTGSTGGEKQTCIEMFDAKGGIRVGLAATEDGDASLVILGKDEAFFFPERK